MNMANQVRIAVLLTVFLLIVPVTAESASELLEEGIYAEETEGDLDKAIGIYEKVLADFGDSQQLAAKAAYQLGICYLKRGQKDKAADYFKKVVSDYPSQKEIVKQAKEQFSKIYPGREIIERSISVTMPAIDPAKLMPADTLAYVELGSPGEQLETILNILKGTPIENPLTLIGGGGTPGGKLGAFFNPSMLAEFKKIRGAALGVTGIGNEPPMVILLEPGESDALRGLIMATVGTIGVPGKMVEGMQTYIIDGQAGAAYDEHVIILARPLEQLNWSVRQYKGITDEPTLASQNESFSRIGRKIRRDNAVTVWVDVDTVFAEIKSQFGDFGLPQELAMADYFMGFEGIDDMFAYLSIEPSGLSLEADINFKQDHRCLAYDLFRTPNISKSAFGAVPERTAAVFSFALNESNGPAVGRAQKAIEHLTGLDIGREIFTNIEQVTVFITSPQQLQKPDNPTLPVLSSVGIVITSHNPQQTRMILSRILRGIELGTMDSQQMQQAHQDQGSGRFVLNIDGDKKVYCHLAEFEKNTLLAFGPEVFDASMSALKGGNSILNTAPLGKVIAQLPDDTSKALMINVGQAVRLAGAYAAIPGGDDSRQLIAQLADAFDKTSVQVRTRESVDHFNLHAGVQDIPPVDEVFEPMVQLAQLSKQAKAKIRAEKARAAGGAIIIRAAKEPVIDGDVDDVWTDAREYKVTHMLGSQVNSPEDLSASYKTMWDEEYLYVLIDVNDDSLMNDSSPSEWWFDDSVEVYIDADNSKSQQYDSNDAQYHFDWDETSPTMDVHNQHGRKENVEFAMVTTENGYRTEIRLAWKTLGVKPLGGASIGLEVQVNDDDDGNQRDTKLMWHDLQDTAWDSPLAFGNANLASLMGWWKFDEVQGVTAKDSNTGNHDGTVVGDAKWTQGKIGGAIELNGNSNFVKIPDEKAFDISGEITISCWVNFNSVPCDYAAIVTKGDNAWRLSTVERQRKFHTSVNGWEQLMVDGAVEVAAGQWHHVAAVYDGRKVCIYVDGKIDVCENWTGGIGRNDYEVLIGENAQERGRCFDGLIDDVRIYNYALSETEIEALSTGQ